MMIVISYSFCDIIALPGFETLAELSVATWRMIQDCYLSLGLKGE